MTTQNDSSFAVAYNYAYDWYKQLSRNDLDKEIEDLEADLATAGRTYHPDQQATLFAAKDCYYARFHGVARDAIKDAIPGKASS